MYYNYTLDYNKESKCVHGFCFLQLNDNIYDQLACNESFVGAHICINMVCVCVYSIWKVLRMLMLMYIQNYAFSKMKLLTSSIILNTCVASVVLNTCVAVNDFLYIDVVTIGKDNLMIACMVYRDVYTAS